MTTNIIHSAIITCYLATGNPCANGHYPTPHYTIAGPRQYPLGSDVYIGTNHYILEDRTARKYNGRWDVFVSCSKEEALRIGKQTNNITIVIKISKRNSGN